MYVTSNSVGAGIREVPLAQLSVLEEISHGPELSRATTIDETLNRNSFDSEGF